MIANKAVQRFDKPIKIHGGKAKLAPWIVSLMPPRCQNPSDPRPGDNGWTHYVEPYYGGGSVMLALNPEGISEVAADTDGRLMNFWNVLADPSRFDQMKRILDATPVSLPKWKDSRQTVLDEVEDAARFFIFCRQSLAGRRKDFGSISRNRTRRGMNEQVASWTTAIDGLPQVHARMRRVLILNQPALSVIASEDTERTLFYLDPPYLCETRASLGEYGLNEMTTLDHEILLQRLSKIKGRFMLSGYKSTLYERYAVANRWKRHEMAIPNSAARGKEKRIMIECVWTNF